MLVLAAGGAVSSETVNDPRRRGQCDQGRPEPSFLGGLRTVSRGHDARGKNSRQ